MSGSVKFYEPWTSGLQLLNRIGLAGFLVVHCFGLLMAFWQAAQIIGPSAFPVLLTNAAIPLMFFIGAIMLAIGLDDPLHRHCDGGANGRDHPDRARDVRLARHRRAQRSVAPDGDLLLLQLVILGAGKLSLDAVLAARFAARAAQ